VAVHRLACPSCGAEIDSAAGFTAGQVARCSKCEKEFTVDDAALKAATDGAGDEFLPGKPRTDQVEWSYRNSTLRHVVLGVLVIIMCVLGYMLYDKKMKERHTAANETEGRGIAPAEVPKEMLPLPGDPIAAGRELAPKILSDPVEAMKVRLVGVWEAKVEGEPIVVEYKGDGTFNYSVAAGGKAAPKLAGKWNVTALDVKMKGIGSKIFDMQMEWTPEGQGAVKEAARVNPNQSLDQPLLDRGVDGKRPTATFIKKKKDAPPPKTSGIAGSGLVP
jgi:hypothetical protein